MTHLIRSAPCLALVAWAWSAGVANAGDWPQILGPQRNGTALNEPRIEPWNEGGPQQLWDAEVGQGFAGPAIAQQKVVAFHRVGRSERAEAFDLATGRQLWRRDFPASYSGTYNRDSGPRCVPLIHDQRVYLSGAAGDLHCIGLSNGEPLWSRDTYGDYRGSEGYFGAGSTPIISDGKLIVNVGGRNAGLVAFDLNTGATIWKATREGASYSSPTAASVGGQEAVIFVALLNALAVNSDGKVLFSFPFGRRGATVNAATPLVFDNYLFLSASYGIGAKLARLGPNPPGIVWENDSTMSSQYTTGVFHNGFLYGVHGREDLGSAELRCVEAKTGAVRWRSSRVGIAHAILVQDRLLLSGVDGRLTLADATPDAFRSLAVATLTTDIARALPALSDGRLVLRDSRRLRCFELRGSRE